MDSPPATADPLLFLEFAVVGTSTPSLTSPGVKAESRDIDFLERDRWK